MNSATWLATAVLTCTVPQALLAAVLVDQHPAATSGVSALRSNLPGPEFDQQVADDFELALPALLSEVSWSGFYFGNSLSGSTTAVDFTVRLFEGNPPPTSPLVSELVAATFVQTGLTDGFDDPIYRFTAPLATPVLLSADTRYWISILDSDAATSVDFRWMNSSSSFNGIYAWRTNEGNSWVVVSDAGDFAFTLAGTIIPEPASVVLTLVAMAILSLRSRNRSGMHAPPTLRERTEP